MRYVQHPDVAYFQVNPGAQWRAMNPSPVLMGARPGMYCDPPCPGKICCANKDCVDFVHECGYKSAMPSRPQKPARPRRRSKSLRRNNPPTIFDGVMNAFGLNPRRRRRR